MTNIDKANVEILKEVIRTNQEVVSIYLDSIENAIEGIKKHLKAISEYSDKDCVPYELAKLQIRDEK